MTKREKTRKRPELGDIAEIKTSKGLAYVQYTHFVKAYNWGHLVRVLPGLHRTRPTDWEKLSSERERFFVFYPLNICCHRGLATIVGNAKIPARAIPFPLMRYSGSRTTPDTGDAQFKTLWDGEKDYLVRGLTREQRDLSIKQIVGHPALVELIESGWKPSDEI